jgi:ABC-type glycerol-3-phosphate transport system substrate-binding protein
MGSPFAVRLKPSRLAFVAAMATFLAACGGDVVCVTVPSPAVLLTVVDSVTGNPVNAAMTVSWTENGGPTTVDQLAASQGPRVVEVGTSSGTYDITVHATGYRDWIQRGIVVPSYGCNPFPAIRTTARLQPAP